MFITIIFVLAAILLLQIAAQRDAFWQDPSRDMSEFFDFSAPNSLQAPTGVPWTQFLPAQPTSAVCDPTKEAGPTF